MTHPGERLGRTGGLPMAPPLPPIARWYMMLGAHERWHSLPWPSPDLGLHILPSLILPLLVDTHLWRPCLIHLFSR